MLNAIKTNKDLRIKLLITLGILFLAQFITNIPAPGINRDMISTFLSSDLGKSMGLLALFSGNSLQNMSMFILGVSPYITASIVLQLLRVAFPKFDEWAKDGKRGEDNYKKLNYFSGAAFSILNAFPIAYGFSKNGIVLEGYLWLVSLSIIAGSIIFMLLGAAIDKWGIKNGISLILMVNIISRIPYDLETIFEIHILNRGVFHIVATVLVTLVVAGILAILTIYLQDGEKRINTQYSGHVAGNKQSRANDSYIPIKVNVAGVMPIIFTLNMFQVYTLIVNIIGVSDTSIFKHIAKALTTSYWFDVQKPYYTLGLLLYILLLIFFQYFYTVIQFDTEQIAENLKKQGGVVTGIRPGKPTKEYLDKKLKSINITGSICLFFVAIIPIVVSGVTGLHSLSLGGTSIIIIVGVLIESFKQIESDSLQSTQTSSFIR